MEPPLKFAYFENTILLAIGTKLEQSWNKVGKFGLRREGVPRSVCHFSPSLFQTSSLPFQLCSDRLHLCSKAPRAQCGKVPQGVFIKTGGSIAVAHMVHGPHSEYCFATVTRVFVPTAVVRFFEAP